MLQVEDSTYHPTNIRIVNGKVISLIQNGNAEIFNILKNELLDYIKKANFSNSIYTNLNTIGLVLFAIIGLSIYYFNTILDITNILLVILGIFMFIIFIYGIKSIIEDSNKEYYFDFEEKNILDEHNDLIRDIENDIEKKYNIRYRFLGKKDNYVDTKRLEILYKALLYVEYKGSNADKANIGLYILDKIDLRKNRLVGKFYRIIDEGFENLSKEELLDPEATEIYNFYITKQI